MKAIVAAFNQEKDLVGAFSVIVQPVVEPMDRFTALVIPHVDVGVQQRLVHVDPLLGVDDEHLAEEVPRLAGPQPVVVAGLGGEEDVREEPLEAVARVPGPVLHVVPDGGLQPPHEVLAGRAELLDDLVPLVDVVCAGEEDPAPATSPRL